MKIIALYPIDVNMVTNFLFEAIQPFPFYETHSESIQQFRYDLLGVNRNVFCCGIMEQDEIVALASYRLDEKQVLFQNLLVRKDNSSDKKGVRYWLNVLTHVAKQEGAEQFSLPLLHVNYELVKRLEELSFNKTINREKQTVFTQSLDYKTGIVFAGGGARGAYQIGAWKAFEELGISYEIICGTSVGALNGGLMLQGDITIAEKMWDEIDTGKILSFPIEKEEDPFGPSKLIKDIQNFAKSAISSFGVSTKPLQNMIAEMLDEDVMYTSKKEFYLCTTQIPTMKEITISLHDTPKEEFSKWLLASSSFFPAMEAAFIKGNYYVDGGYRNNVPVDVALRAGATELIIIDVKGPGITKLTKIPEAIPTRTISSPWSLGTVLLFDGARSAWNIDLGYLETMKAFGTYMGYWYTFDHHVMDSEINDVSKQFLDFVAQGPWDKGKGLQQNSEIAHGLYKKIRKVYNDRVTTETIGVVVLEFVAKGFNLSPTKLYTVESMKEAIKEKLYHGWTNTEENNETMMLSLQEWAAKFAKKLPLPTEKQQVVYLYHQLKLAPDTTTAPLLSFIINAAPLVYLSAMCICWLEKELEENGTGV